MRKQASAMSAAEFRAWRKRHGLTQQQAAEALGHSKRAVEQWEAGGVIARTVLLSTRWLDEHPEALAGAARALDMSQL